MKTMRGLVVTIIAMTLVGRLFAQIEFVSIEKLTDFVQTSAGAPTLRPFIGSPSGPTSAPYQFRVDVEGTNISGITAPTFTFPVGSTYGGSTTLMYDPSGDSWRRSQLFGTKYNPTGGAGGTPIGLDAVFKNGQYTVTAGGETFVLNLGGVADADVYPPTPMATLSAGTWAGGMEPRLILNQNEALTISTNSFTNYGLSGGALDHVGLFISHNGTDLVDLQSFSDDTHFPGASNATFLSHTFGANTLSTGMHFVEMEFVTAMTLDATTLDGAIAVALFTSRTQFAIDVQAIPEPSTYAAIFGTFALAGAAWWRRRRAA